MCCTGLLNAAAVTAEGVQRLSGQGVLPGCQPGPASQGGCSTSTSAACEMETAIAILLARRKQYIISLLSLQHMQQQESYASD
jgi:hypothetical protein